MENYNQTREAGYGLPLREISQCLSCAPFAWLDIPSQQKFPMKFMGGIVAVTQDEKTLALEPVTGWAVLDSQQ